MDRPSEFELIASLFAPLATVPEAFGLTDDAAQIPVKAGCDLVVTADALVEGVHFLSDDPPDTVAAKALAVNLSDLAAKGAEPAGYLLALSLPARIDGDWLAAFAGGLAAMGTRFAIPLLGGDTTATPGPLTLAVTAIGHVPAGTMIRRRGAHVGDGVYVSGTVGDAGAGLDLLTSRPNGRRPASAAPAEPLRTAQPARAKTNDFLIARYRTPTPRLALGQALRGIASAGLDVSDGLLADLGHIAEVSQVGIRVEAGRIPLSAPLRALGETEAAILRAATAGDDYELAFTAAAETEVAAAAVRAGIAVTRIGTVVEGRGIHLIGADGEIAVSRPGFRHF